MDPPRNSLYNCQARLHIKFSSLMACGDACDPVGRRGDCVRYSACPSHFAVGGTEQFTRAHLPDIEQTITMSPVQVEIAVRKYAESRRDQYYEELNSHYKLEKLLLMTLTLAFQAAAADTANRNQYLAFRAHFINAHLCSRSNIRRYDILRWLKKELVPGALQSIVVQLSHHYTKECALRNRLAQCEGYEHGYAMTDEDEQWAAVSCPGRVRHYGFHIRGPGIDVFTPKFEANPRQLARYLTACLEIRILLIQRMVMRGSAFPFGLSIGGQEHKVAQWLRAALVYLEQTTPLFPVLTGVMSRAERFRDELERIWLLVGGISDSVQKNNKNVPEKMADPSFAAHVGLIQDREAETQQTSSRTVGTSLPNNDHGFLTRHNPLLPTTVSHSKAALYILFSSQALDQKRHIETGIETRSGEDSQMDELSRHNVVLVCFKPSSNEPLRYPLFSSTSIAPSPRQRPMPYDEDA
nr:hypothetical protein CFP56_21918 [Quercus suber]